MNRITKAIAAGAIALSVAFSATACSGGGKPSKEEVRAAFESEMSNTAGAPDETVDQMVDCMVDDLYENLSDEALRAIANKDESYRGTTEDEEVLSATTEKCTNEMIESMG